MIHFEELQRAVEEIEGVNEVEIREPEKEAKSIFNEPHTPKNAPQYANIHKEYGIDDCAIRINSEALIARCYINGRFTAEIDMAYGTLVKRDGDDKYISDGLVPRDKVVDTFKKECGLEDKPMWVIDESGAGYLEVDGAEIRFDKYIEPYDKSLREVQKEMLEIDDIKEILTDFAETVGKNEHGKSEHKNSKKETVELV